MGLICVQFFSAPRCRAVTNDTALVTPLLHTLDNFLKRPAWPSLLQDFYNVTLLKFNGQQPKNLEHLINLVKTCKAA